MGSFHYVLPLMRTTKTRSKAADWPDGKPPRKYRHSASQYFDAHRGARWYWEEPCEPYENPAIKRVLGKLRAAKLEFRETYTATHLVIDSIGENRAKA